MPQMPASLQHIEKLQKHRARRQFDVTIDRIVSSTFTEVERKFKKLGRLVQLWQEVVPDEVCARTALTGLRRGVLHVVVDSSSTSFELDRLLRNGVGKELRSRYRGTFSRVKIQVGEFENSIDSRQAA